MSILKLSSTSKHPYDGWKTQFHAFLTPHQIEKCDWLDAPAAISWQENPSAPTG
jgi:hypothetical protein